MRLTLLAHLPAEVRCWIATTVYRHGNHVYTSDDNEGTVRNALVHGTGYATNPQSVVAGAAPKRSGGTHMASRPLLAAETAHARRMADMATASEVAQRFTGWKVFSSRDGMTRVATRTGNPVPPDDDDNVWAATLIADSWTDLEQQLAEQAQRDAERTYEARA
jgi:hypothetical protein